tara:strand:- start:961 stop:1419 length:459 start_codon:yes stop_codon:yes gene_type:complete
MPRIIQTNPDGSPVGNYLTQSRRFQNVNPIQKTQFQVLPSGIRYAYSGTDNAGVAGAISITMLDIVDTGDVDLLCILNYSTNFDVVPSNEYTGFSVTINDSEIFFTRSDADIGLPRIESYEFICPAHSNLKVLGLAQTTTADRTASIIGKPL